MEEAIRFLNELKENPEMKELLKKQPKPANDEEAAAAYVRIAEKMGYSVTKEDIIRSLKNSENSRKKMADEANESVMKEALDEDDLDHVAGGIDPFDHCGQPQWVECNSSYYPGEWCWIEDSCSLIITSYSNSEEENITEPDPNYQLDDHTLKLLSDFDTCGSPSFDANYTD